MARIDVEVMLLERPGFVPVMSGAAVFTSDIAPLAAPPSTGLPRGMTQLAVPCGTVTVVGKLLRPLGAVLRTTV